jgi:hypothetical protein
MRDARCGRKFACSMFMLRRNPHRRTAGPYTSEGREVESTTQTGTEEPQPTSRLREFAEVLKPLFWMDEFKRADSLLEFVCALVRAAGLEDTGWDSYQESLTFLEDLKRLWSLELPKDVFPEPDHTRVRLYLVSYCHVTEMDFPYELMANLLRLRLGKKYAINPFEHLYPHPKKKSTTPSFLQDRRPPSPETKIKEIERLSQEAGMPEVGRTLRGVYDRVIRNAVYHSDYVLHGGSMRLLSAYRKSKRDNVMTKVIKFDELMESLNDAFAFYSALLVLYNRARSSFRGFHHSMLPFDPFYKGLLELTFDDKELTGFRAYWPNESLSIYSRTKEGCVAQNITFEADGSVNFMVGLYAGDRGEFSPLVERGAEPKYPAVPGTDVRPYWPAELKSYCAY